MMATWPSWRTHSVSVTQTRSPPCRQQVALNLQVFARSFTEHTFIDHLSCSRQRAPLFTGLITAGIYEQILCAHLKLQTPTKTLSFTEVNLLRPLSNIFFFLPQSIAKNYILYHDSMCLCEYTCVYLATRSIHTCTVCFTKQFLSLLCAIHSEILHFCQLKEPTNRRHSLKTKH